jgi:hypothetical protein
MNHVLKTITAVAVSLILISSLAACGGTGTASQGTKETAPNETTTTKPTITDGLRGTCSGNDAILNNRLSEATLTTEDGRLNIHVPNASEMKLVDIGYYFNIYADDDQWTRVELKYDHSTGTNSFTVIDMEDETTVVDEGSFERGEGDSLDISLPSEDFKGDANWRFNSVLTMNKKDTAACPADTSDSTPLE